MITDKLGEQIGLPFHSQMAVDSIWEEAVQTDLTPASIKHMLDAMAQRSGRLAVEVTYKLGSGRRMYFGLKHDPGFANAPTPQTFLDKLSGILPRVAEVNFNEGIALFGSELNGDENTFLHQTPDEIELGVNNNWVSAGPCKLWQAGEPMPTAESLTARLQGHDVLLHNTLNFIGMEHIFDDPTNHWLSVEVSNADNGQYILDQQFALQIAQLSF